MKTALLTVLLCLSLTSIGAFADYHCNTMCQEDSNGNQICNTNCN